MIGIDIGRKECVSSWLFFIVGLKCLWVIEKELL